MSQINDISLVAQVVVFKNTRAFDQLVKKYQSPVRRFFLNRGIGSQCDEREHLSRRKERTVVHIWYFRSLSLLSTICRVSQRGSTALPIMFFMIIFAAGKKWPAWTQRK